MIKSAEDVIPHAGLADELYRLGGLPFDWMEVIPRDAPEFRLEVNVAALPPLVSRLLDLTDRRWNELTPLLIFSKWLQGGPKIVRPTAEQAEALAQVAINLELKDHSQPFPAVLCETPCPPFVAVICHRHKPDVLLLQAISEGRSDDVICAVRQDGRPIEAFLNRVDEDCVPLLGPLLGAQRLALNMMLALTNFGCTSAPLFAKQHQEDVRLAKRDDESGARAKRRVRYAAHEVRFAHTVVIRRPSPRDSEGAPSGRTVKQHWVRGHWKMQRCGTGGLERRPLLIRPYLTHAEQGEPSPAPVAYVDRR